MVSGNPQGVFDGSLRRQPMGFRGKGARMKAQTQIHAPALDAAWPCASLGDHFIFDLWCSAPAVGVFVRACLDDCGIPSVAVAIARERKSSQCCRPCQRHYDLRSLGGVSEERVL